MKQYKKLMAVLLASAFLLGGCGSQVQSQTINKEMNPNLDKEAVSLAPNSQSLDFEYTIHPETFEIMLHHEGESIPVSMPIERREVSELKEEEGLTSWVYPDERLKVVVKEVSDYLQVELTTLGVEGDQTFSWPKVAGESYVLPLREGKYIPSEDNYWKDYLNQQTFEMIESLSMRFFGVNHGAYSVLYVMDDLYHSEMAFDAQEKINFEITHQYQERNPDKSYGFRIYLTPQNPVDLAKIYRNYLIEQGEFKTLAEKAKENPNIEKLYGAVNIYLWDSYGISEENIKWQAFQNESEGEVVEWIKTLLKEVEDGKDSISALEAIKNQDYVDNYQKNVICRGLTEVLKLREFYNPDVFKVQTSEIEQLLEKGINNLNQVEIISLNKAVLQANMKDIVAPVEEWADSRGMDILEELKESGIDHAWIGLDHWMQGMMKPELVNYAVASGYLIGPYDSYHSIHEPGAEKWHTAAFTDKTLYERATVQNSAGDYEKGFKGVGRKLNPTLTLEAVKARVEEILATGLPFNTWFVDCDATGEIYDDYSPQHETTAQEDLKARLDRMNYIAQDKNMVVGSEGGNDFASQTIALAHGLELPSFSWMDEDMKQNKDSEYYMGKYYSPKGGVPEHFAKQIPVKEPYKKIFLDEAYNIPLFKLVYNDAMITTYHWDWSTFKIKDEVPNRMLYEILYNVPPLYHLDKWEWEENKEQMIRHANVYEEMSQKVINEEMTDFAALTSDRRVQMTAFGDKLKVVANFKEEPYVYEGTEIEPQSLIIIEQEKVTHYKP